METINYTDTEIVNKIKSGGNEIETASMHLFHNFKHFLPQVSERINISQQHLQDAFAHAVVKYVRHVKDGTYKEGSDVSNYFYTLFYDTAFKLMTRVANKNNQAIYEPLVHNAKEQKLLEIASENQEETHVVKVIDQMGELCKRVLKDWGYYQYSMEEIAKRSNLNNAASATNTKHKCLKNLRELLNAKMYKV